MEQKKKDWFCDSIHEIREEMYRMAFYILENEEDSKDAVSEAIFAAYENISSLRNEKHFKTWIIKIVANKAKDIRRIRQKEILGKEDGVVSRYDRWDSYVEWADILEKVPIKYKMVLVLYYWEEYKIGEISEILEIPQGTVKSRLARAEGFVKKEFHGGK